MMNERLPHVPLPRQGDGLARGARRIPSNPRASPRSYSPTASLSTVEEVPFTATGAERAGAATLKRELLDSASKPIASYTNLPQQSGNKDESVDGSSSRLYADSFAYAEHLKEMRIGPSATDFLFNAVLAFLVASAVLTIMRVSRVKLLTLSLLSTLAVVLVTACSTRPIPADVRRALRARAKEREARGLSSSSSSSSLAAQGIRQKDAAPSAVAAPADAASNTDSEVMMTLNEDSEEEDVNKPSVAAASSASTTILIEAGRRNGSSGGGEVTKEEIIKEDEIDFFLRFAGDNVPSLPPIKSELTYAGVPSASISPAGKTNKTRVNAAAIPRFNSEYDEELLAETDAYMEREGTLTEHSERVMAEEQNQGASQKGLDAPATQAILFHEEALPSDVGRERARHAAGAPFRPSVDQTPFHTASFNATFDAVYDTLDDVRLSASEELPIPIDYWDASAEKQLLENQLHMIGNPDYKLIKKGPRHVDPYAELRAEMGLESGDDGWDMTPFSGV